MLCPKTGLLIKPSYGRFIYFKLLTAVPMGTALLGLFKYSDSLLWPLIYIGVCITHLSIVYTNKCPHCAYYHLGGKEHRCSWLWHIPKIVKPKPGPQGKFVTKYIPFGILTLSLYPVYWLHFQWELLVIYLLSLGIILTSVLMHECSRCISFHCGNNSVSDELRQTYFQKYQRPG